MKIDQGIAHTNHKYWTVLVDANELVVASGKSLPYSAWIGTVDEYGRINVWTPAASVPRGYRDRALAMLEEARKTLQTEGKVSTVEHYDCSRRSCRKPHPVGSDCSTRSIDHDYQRKAYNKYGASMGRSDSLPEDTTAKLTLRKVRLDLGGYDEGGAYWGARDRGHSLYCAEDSDGNARYVDARDRADAKRHFPNARFYR